MNIFKTVIITGWKRYYSYFLIGGVLLYGVVLRIISLGGQSYWMDEGYTINAVLSILSKGVSVLDSGYPYSCSLYCYPTSWIATIGGNSAFSFRLFAVIAGIGGIVFLFFMVRKMLSHRVALFSTILLSLSYWQIAWSRQARWYTLFLLLFWVTWYCYYHYLYGQKKKIALVGTLLFSVLTIISHGIGYGIIPICLVWGVIHYLFFSTEKKRFWYLSSMILGFLAILLLLEYVLHISFLPYIRNIPALYDHFCTYASFFVHQYWFSLIFAGIGLYLLRSEHRRVILFLSFPFLSYFFYLSFGTSLLEFRYLFHVTPIFFILAAYGIDRIYDVILSYTRWKKILIGIGIFSLFILSGQGIIFPQSFYTLEQDPEGANKKYVVFTPQPDWNEAYRFVQEQRSIGDIIISTQPQFTKIFLQEAGYWLQYSRLYGGQVPTLRNGREFYVNAKVLDSVERLQNVTRGTHGFVILDYYTLQNTLPNGVLEYITNHFYLAYTKEINNYSQIWIYKF